MRLIGTFNTEKEAYTFYSFLLKEGVQNIYEPCVEEKTGAKQYRIWVYDEDDLDNAIEWMQSFKEKPDDPKFQSGELPMASTPPSPGYSEISESEDEKWQSRPSVRIQTRPSAFTLTNLIIILCGILFIWNNIQESKILQDRGQLVEEIAMTPLQKDLLFDDPSSYQYIQEMIDTVPLNSYKELKELPPEATALIQKAEQTHSWRGAFDFFMSGEKPVPMFEKIRQGEVWRLFTPCLMHHDFLHILFNMVWVWILVKQSEPRLRKWKICLLILIIGVISNIAQYLVSGPYFVGFSGVIVGLAGFIWVRQKRAPWEGYPLQRGTALFLLFFVLAMFAIELITFGLQLLSVIKITPNIANTAHIIGGLTGMILARFSLFSRKMS
jgi:GlpG protein